jgi:PAS domain S-box-containing protein
MRFRWLEQAGTYRWAECRMEPRHNTEGAIAEWYGVSLDIDDEIRAQEAVRDRERELLQLVDLVPSHIWRLSPDGEPVFFNRRMVNYLGLDVGDVDRPGMSRLEAVIRTAVHPEDAAEFRRAIQHSLVSGDTFSSRYRLRRADGVYRWMSSRAEPLRGKDGRVVQWFGLCHDIDDQIHAEEILRESERQLRRLVDALPTQIWAATADGNPSYLNRRLAEYVGLTLTDLDTAESPRLQVAIQHSVHPEDAPAVGRALAHSFATGETFAMKYRQRRADGVHRWVNGRAEPLRDAEGRILQWYGVSFDIDDEVRTQDELRRTQERLAVASQAASLAELSASIAHEVNQPLAAVVANSHACHRWLSADPPNLDRAKVTAERIIRDANAAADVVDRIRALFRQSTGARTATGVAAVVSEARDLMAEEAARRNVRLEVAIPPGLPKARLDRVQIQQVLVNLMRNGIDAMDGLVGDRVLGVRVGQREDRIEVEISDRGPGIASPEKAFEPFFTTKEDGMGMGLAIARSIIESHGGRLWVEPNAPHGSRFVFALPVEVKAAA